MSETQQTIWEEKYAQGLVTLAPWSHVVVFLFKEAPLDKPRKEVQVLEVGCGTGSNLFFAAQMGFSVTGIDFAETAINFSRKRFAEHQLSGKFHVADATALPFAENSFDLVIDRAALTACPDAQLGKAIQEIHRVLKVGGKFFFNPYSSRCTSASSGVCQEGRMVGGYRTGIEHGLMLGVGGINFMSDTDIQRVLAPSMFDVQQMVHMEYMDMKDPLRCMQADWRVILKKI